jgi:hypothetical protein
MKAKEQITMSALEEMFNKAIEEDELGIALLIEMPGFEEPEVIINPPVNLTKKLEYIKKTYDENLEHKHSKGVNIIGCATM